MLKRMIKGFKKAFDGCMGGGETETVLGPVWIDEEQCLQGESSWTCDSYNLDKLEEKTEVESSAQELKVVLSPWSFSSVEVKRMLQRRRQGNATHTGLFHLSERDRKVLCKLYEEDKYKNMTEMERRVLVLQQGILRYRRTLSKTQRSRIAQENKFVRNEHSKMLEECWGKYFVEKASRNLQESPPRVEELADNHAATDVPLRLQFQGQDKPHLTTKLQANEHHTRKEQCPSHDDQPFLKSVHPYTTVDKLDDGHKSFRISAHHADEAMQPKLSFQVAADYQ
eukprot:jgi/Picsp_1/2789/NSC_01015-R1_---NA---